MLQTKETNPSVWNCQRETARPLWMPFGTGQQSLNWWLIRFAGSEMRFARPPLDGGQSTPDLKRAELTAHLTSMIDCGSNNRETLGGVLKECLKERKKKEIKQTKQNKKEERQLRRRLPLKLIELKKGEKRVGFLLNLIFFPPFLYYQFNLLLYFFVALLVCGFWLVGCLSVRSGLGSS